MYDVHVCFYEGKWECKKLRKLQWWPGRLVKFFWQAIAIGFIPFGELSECKVIFTSALNYHCLHRMPTQRLSPLPNMCSLTLLPFHLRAPFCYHFPRKWMTLFWHSHQLPHLDLRCLVALALFWVHGDTLLSLRTLHLIASFCALMVTCSSKVSLSSSLHRRVTFTASFFAFCSICIIHIWQIIKLLVSWWHISLHRPK